VGHNEIANIKPLTRVQVDIDPVTEKGMDNIPAIANRNQSGAP
jgi:hypothetical protein